jgi:hypothetical protein
MCIGILVRLATERASLHHVDKTGFQLKVHVPHDNVGSSSHIGGGGDGEVVKSLFGRRLRRGWCLDDWFDYRENELRRVGPFSRETSHTLSCFHPAGENKSNIILYKQ